jgi:hypothetical protein
MKVNYTHLSIYNYNFEHNEGIAFCELLALV